MRLINVAVVLITLVTFAHAAETTATAHIDAAPIEEPPLPRPRPLLHDVTADNPAVLISAFRLQNGESAVAVSPALARLAQEQANAMAVRTRSVTKHWLPFQVGSAAVVSVTRRRISHTVIMIFPAP